MTCKVLTHLSTLPLLHTFSVLILSELGLDNPEDQTDFFPSLVCLMVHANNFSGLVKFLSLLSSDRLERLFITKHGDEESDLRPLFEALTAFKSSSCLKELHVLRENEVRWSGPGPHMSEVSLPVLALLFPLRQLEVLKITIDIEATLTDANLKGIADAWPNLRVFRLFEDARGPASQVSLTGVLDLTSSLNLSELTIRMSCASPINHHIVRTVNPRPALRRLNVCTSSIADPEVADNVLEIFTLAFPSLDRFVSGWEEAYFPGNEPALRDAEYRDYWRDILESLKPLIARNRKYLGFCDDSFT